MDDILVTVIVPVYNTEIEYLEKCFTSISSQTLTKIEVLIIDDGSCDKVYRYCEDACNQYKYFRVIHQANAGVSVARNTGLKNAKGVFISFIDSDDWVDKDYLEKMLCSADSNTDIVLSGYDKYHNDRKKQNYLINKKNNKDIFSLKNIGFVWGKLYRKDFINEMYFNAELTHGEDVAFNFCLLEMKPCYCIANTKYHYRIDSLSAVRKFNQGYVEKYTTTLFFLKEKALLSRELYLAYCEFVFIVLLVVLDNYYFHIENADGYLLKRKKLKVLCSRYAREIESCGYVHFDIAKKLILFCFKLSMIDTVLILFQLRKIRRLL